MDSRKWEVRVGDCVGHLAELEDCSVDALVTDPPAGISFMGKDWDRDKGGRDAWIEWMAGVMKDVLRVLKPGAHGFVWALPRTSHWTATALENAGFEIRDIVTHLFGSGFPKSANISKAIDRAAGATVSVIDAAREWEGWGTALKPASEHWILVRKPLSEKTVVKNVLKHGTGGINIDGCRIATNWDTDPTRRGWQGGRRPGTGPFTSGDRTRPTVKRGGPENASGRWPANLVLNEEAARVLDEQSGDLHPPGTRQNRTNRSPFSSGTASLEYVDCINDTGGASRFFYCAKAGRAEREQGLQSEDGKTGQQSSNGEGSCIDALALSSCDSPRGAGARPVLRIWIDGGGGGRGGVSISRYRAGRGVCGNCACEDS